MSKRTRTKFARTFESEMVPYNPETLQPISNPTKITKDTKYYVKHTKRPAILPAADRTPFTFEIQGIRVTVMLSDGQIVNKKKAFKRYLEDVGGMAEARLRQRRLEESGDLPAVTRVNAETYEIVEPESNGESNTTAEE